MKVHQVFDRTGEVARLAETFAQRRSHLANEARGMDGFSLTAAYSNLTDDLVRAIWEVVVSDDGVGGRQGRNAASTHVVIAGVGGSGRREQAPYSDVDVAFITSGVEEQAVDLVTKCAFRMLVDIVECTGLKLGYSYRRVDDLADLSLETQTALLDARAIVGNEALLAQFKAELIKYIVPFVFVRSHLTQRNSSLTPFTAEPNLKEGCGCLRDLQTARWLAEISFGMKADHWTALRAMGILSDHDVEKLLLAEEFLLRARCALQLAAERPVDILSRERQPQVASALGFPNTEELMTKFYSHAHQVRMAFELIADSCLESSLELEPGVAVRSGRIFILDRGLLARQPSALIRLFSYAGAYGLRFSRDAVNTIRYAAGQFAPSQEVGAAFLEVVSSYAALRSMANLGVLQAIVPEFADLMRLIPSDEAHRWTIGEHSLRTVEELENLQREKDERFATAYSRVEHPNVLMLAGLLHDIGKLAGSQDHAQVGAELAMRVARSVGMPSQAVENVGFLVANHLIMAETARLRDLHQPRTISDFVAAVNDPQLLDMLFLLTAADSRAVGTANWTQVQMRFLTELYERASALLRSSEAAPPDIERHRRRLRRELSLANIPHEQIDEHCESMPASYLLNTSPEELATHIGYVQSVRRGNPVVEIKDDPHGEFTLVTVVAFDKVGLLSQIAGVLYALGIDVHAAQVFTRSAQDKIAIDTLYVDSNGRQLSPTARRHLESCLTDVLNGKIGLDHLLKRMDKRLCPLPGHVTLRVLEGVSDHHTVIEIKAQDAPGLLHWLTRTISEIRLDIHSARISTWGRQAHDVFYLGGHLPSRTICELRSRLQAQC